MKQDAGRIAGAAVLIALAAIGISLFANPDPGRARADDAYRTSALSIRHDYFGVGDDRIVATISSTSSDDVRVEISLVWYDDGQPEQGTFSTWADRTWGAPSVHTEAALDLSEFPDTNVKAYFTVKDAAGHVTWSASRTIST